MLEEGHQKNNFNNQRSSTEPPRGGNPAQYIETAEEEDQDVSLENITKKKNNKMTHSLLKVICESDFENNSKCYKIKIFPGNIDSGKDKKSTGMKSNDDPAEFEEPELYESMRLLREAEEMTKEERKREGTKEVEEVKEEVEEEGVRKRRGGSYKSANPKRPTLNLEKMLKV